MTFILKTLFEEYETNEERLMGTEATITAHAGGGAVSARKLTKKWNIINTVASSNDSVMIPLALIGQECWVLNLGASTLEIFTEALDFLDAVNSSSIKLEPNEAVMFKAAADQYWYTAYRTNTESVLLTAVVTLTAANIDDLDNTAIDAIAAPPVGYTIDVVSAVDDFSGNNTNNGANVHTTRVASIVFDTATTGLMTGVGYDATVVSGSPVPYKRRGKFFQSSCNPNMLENKKVVIKDLVGNIDGTPYTYGTAKVKILYRILSTT